MPLCKRCGGERSPIAVSNTATHYICWQCGRFSLIKRLRPWIDKLRSRRRREQLKRIKGTAVKDGPIFDYPYRGLECYNCNNLCFNDMFFFRGLQLCGDCRFKERHGYWPSHSSGAGSPSDSLVEAEPKYHGGFGSETLSRYLEFDAVSEQHVAFLNSWIDDSKLSLD